MCRYKRAEQCSKEMHSKRMCRECYLETQRANSRKYHREHSNQREQLTIGQMIELHKNSFMARAWV